MRFFLCTAMFICSLALFSQEFEDITNESGISFIPVHQNLMGGGVSWVDYNNDGLVDLYYSGLRIRDALYKNNGDGTFTNSSVQAGLTFTDSYDTMGAVFGDVNNDGFDDVFISTRKVIATNELGRNLFYLNNGDGTFTDITVSAGLDDEVWSTSSAMLDINLDGFLDVYVLNYMENSGFITDDEGNTIGFDHECFENFLYLNNGDLTFTESAEEYGLNSLGCGLALSASDVDKDGDPDLQLANDFGEFGIPNQLFINDYPNPQFIDASEMSGFDVGMYGMGVAVGDIDNDLDQDFYATNLGKNAFLLNNGDGTSFDEVAEEAGIDNTGNGDLFFTSWGDMFLDVDNDSFLDLFVANGHMSAASFIENVQDDPNKLYMNNGDLTFSDLSEESGLDYKGICRGAAFGDVDKDGFLDISASGIQNPFFNFEGVKLYKNLEEEGNWIGFTLEGTEVNRNAFGSSVTVYFGQQSFYRELLGGSSHLSQNEQLLHFGLGLLTEIDSLEVSWTGGRKEIFDGLEINMYHHIIQSETSQIINRENEGFFSLFPNPLGENEVLSIEAFDKGTFNIFDSAGKEVYSEAVRKGRNEIVPHLKSGIYIAKLKTGKQAWATTLHIVN